jgi:pSer/pThr/pTyr-binding forkhead associated (FHA) protein
VYLLKGKVLDTEPLDVTGITWLGEARCSRAEETVQSNSRPLTIRLRIGPCVGKDHQIRELEVSLAKPIRLGRADPAHDIFPEVDLTQDLARERGVSRRHTCIFRQGSTVKLEDLGSINGTLLNGDRMAPFISEILKDGDQFQMGQLLITVSFGY